MPITDRKALNGRGLYKCDHCGKLAPWAEGWSWYGSYRDLDNGDPIIVHCLDCPTPKRSQSIGIRE